MHLLYIKVHVAALVEGTSTVRPLLWSLFLVHSRYVTIKVKYFTKPSCTQRAQKTSLTCEQFAYAGACESFEWKHFHITHFIILLALSIVRCIIKRNLNKQQLISSPGQFSDAIHQAKYVHNTSSRKVNA